VRDLRGLVSATGNFQTHGLAREELAENLIGQMELQVRDISFGDFDPLAALAQQAHWGKLEPARFPVTAPPAVMMVEIRDRQFLLKTLALDLSGARLQFNGAYDWAGPLNLNVRADLLRLRRHWLAREDDPQLPARLEEVRLGGRIDRLVVNPQEGVASVGSSRAGGRQ
jgi:hypothetical protein